MKKLNFQVESVVVSGIGTFKSFFKLEMKKYFDDKYKIESRKEYSGKEYSIATLVDLRYKSAGFRSKESAGIATSYSGDCYKPASTDFQ